MGRLAGRKAVAQLTGWAPHEFRIRSLDSGQPVVEPVDSRHPTRSAVSVSISHGPLGAVGYAVHGGFPGIDIERIEIRSPSFARTWFTEGEISISAGDARIQTQIWCAKEAVLKAFGTGMRLHPREIEDPIVDPSSGQCRAAWRSGWYSFGFGWWRNPSRLTNGDEWVVATALLSPGVQQSSEVAARTIRNIS